MPIDISENMIYFHRKSGTHLIEPGIYRNKPLFIDIDVFLKQFSCDSLLTKMPFVNFILTANTARGSTLNVYKNSTIQAINFVP